MADPTHIHNWRRLDDRITTSGQPTEDQLTDIRDLGVTHVVNLALHSHEMALPDEAASVAALGMTYIHIPVEFERPTEDDFVRFCAAMTEIAGRPVHVHCIVNARVSAFLYRYRRDVLGREDSAARALMDSVWRPGGVWARFIGDDDSADLPHRPPA
ncbi:MAG: protein tyrosine phosphatase family protein [Sphingomonadales bacterium]